MAKAGNSLVAPTSSTHPGGTASGSRVSKQAGMPRKRRRPNTRKSPKKKKQQSGDDAWCEIKGILGEREVNGQVQYLVDWEDHPTTGEVYPQEWKIKADLSKQSIAQWEETKRQQTIGPPASDEHRSLNESSQPSKADDSQEPRPACYHRRSSLPLSKRPRPQLQASDSADEDSEADRSRKRIRLSSELSAGSAPSFTTSASTDREQLDSPPLASARTYCQVILDQKSDFDPTEYQSVHLTQSTSQHISSQSVSVLESQDQNIVLSIGHSQGTIPDSQEPSTFETQQSRSSENQQGGRRGNSQVAVTEPALQIEDTSSQPFELDGASALITIPDSIPPVLEAQAAASIEATYSQLRSEGDSWLLRESAGGQRLNEESIPSHQPEGFCRVDTWPFETPDRAQGADDFHSQSRIAMSTPREGQGPPGPGSEGPSSRQEGSSTSNAANVFLTQPAQLNEGPQPFSFSDILARENEKLQQLRDAGSSSDDEDEDKEEAAGRETYVPEVEPATVAPADIEPAQPQTEIPVLPSVDLSGMSIPTVQTAAHESPATDDLPSRPSSPQVLTLPLLANRRYHYLKEIESHRESIQRWSQSFKAVQAGEASSIDKQASTAIERLFQRLQDECDYAQYDLLEQPQSPKDRVNWWCSANSKFNFLHELLKGLGEVSLPSAKALKITIVVDLSHVLQQLCELLEFLGITYICNSLSKSFGEVTSTSNVKVTLALLDEHVDIWEADVVIAYGMSFNGSDLDHDLRADAQGRTQPLLLKLAIAQSIEHADIDIRQLGMRLESRDEHTYALLYAIVQNMTAIRHPPSFMDEGEPQRLAEELCSYLLGLVDFAEINIEPWPLVCSVTEALESSQSSDPQNEQDGGRKRPRVEDEDEEAEEAKRLRRHSRAEGGVRPIPLNSALREFLAESGWDGVNAGEEPHITLPLSVLEELRARSVESTRVAADLEAELSIQNELKQIGRSREEDQPFYDRVSEELRRALSDRTAAEEDAKSARDSLSKKEVDFTRETEKINAKLQKLEDENTRLRSNTATVDSEKLLKEAEDKVKRLESRLQTAQSNEAYMRDQYHAMSSNVAERRDLEARIESLQQEADANKLEIQRTNNEHSTKALLSQIAELQTRLEFSNVDLSRLHEENRQLKNRRETRQSSAPRSPRPGLMSPRPRGPLSSREVSPVMGGFGPSANNGGIAGVQYTSQNGGARWGRGQVP